tara:strand:+ start:655 stop:768 length:114 start_codon:yes stop_codon:yes gene_type:complete
VKKKGTACSVQKGEAVLTILSKKRKTKVTKDVFAERR